MLMVSNSFWVSVEEVLNLLKEHSEKYKQPKQAMTKVERLSGWAILAGGVLYAAGEVLRQVGVVKTLSLSFAYLPLIILGFVMFTIGTLALVIEGVRTTRRPVLEHFSGVIEALDRECELITALERFEVVTLEFVCKRLQLESTKVTSRLGVIGGGDGLRTSLVGVAMLGAALISQYEAVVHGWTMKSVAFFGLALLLGLSIGGLLVRYGVSQGDYYCGIIELALQRKACQAKKPARERFGRRVGRRGGRSGLRDEKPTFAGPYT